MSPGRAYIYLAAFFAIVMAASTVRRLTGLEVSGALVAWILLALTGAALAVIFTAAAWLLRKRRNGDGPN